MRNAKWWLALPLCWLALTAQAQMGQTFPDIEGKTLTGQQVTLPAVAKGKYTLVGLAYSQKSQDDLETWFQPVFDTFISKNKSMWDVSGSYDVNIYFVPMLSGIKGAAAGKVENKLNKELDKELKPHVMIYKGSIKEYKEALGLEGKDTPYFYVLDEAGKVVYQTTGAYSEKKLGQMEAVLPEK